MESGIVWIYEVTNKKKGASPYTWVFSSNPDHRVLKMLLNDIAKQDKIPIQHLLERLFEVDVDDVNPKYKGEL